MAGINRLGKAPPRPGSLRPPDPNRNRILDVYSEGTEGDADYARMVQDIEDAQQSQVGWLFGRGAFDKGDLLYLRDEEEKRRFKEEELRDSERAAFLRLQASAGAGPGPGSGGAPGRPGGPQRDRPARSQASLLANIVRVKSARPAKRNDPHDGAAEAPAKRAKTASAAAAAESEDEDNGAGAGLAGLIGDYGSDKEEEEEEEDGGVHAEAAAPDGALPAAANREANGSAAPEEPEEHVDYSGDESA